MSSKKEDVKNPSPAKRPEKSSRGKNHSHHGKKDKHAADKVGSTNWQEVLAKRVANSTRFNGGDSSGQILSASPEVFQVPLVNDAEAEKNSEPPIDFSTPWTSLLPSNVQEMCTQAGFTPEFCQQHLKVIYSVGIFLCPESFDKEKRFPHGTEAYCDPQRVEAATQLVQTPSKPIKKMFKGMKPVGEGGFGSVFMAKAKVIPKSGAPNMPKKVKYVAVKKVSHTTAREKRANLDEIAYLSTLDHPNIVNFFYVLHVVEADSKTTKAFDELWIITEYLQGGTLADASKFSNWPQNSVAFVAWQILLALEYLHDQKFAHRDLKSNNIMMSVKGEIKLIDFGLCCDFSKSTQTKILGTSHWIPPEMILREPHNVNVDIWSFGVCIFELFNRGPPFKNQTFKCMVSAATVGFQDQIPTNHPQVGKTAQDFLKNCLVVDPTKRATAKDLLKHTWITKNAREDNGGIIKILSQIFLAKALAV